MGLELLIMACAVGLLALTVRIGRRRGNMPVSLRGLDRPAEYCGWLTAGALLGGGLVTIVGFGGNSSPPVWYRTTQLVPAFTDWVPVMQMRGAAGSPTSKPTVGRLLLQLPRGTVVKGVYGRVSRVTVKGTFQETTSFQLLRGWALWTDIVVPLAFLLAVVLAALLLRNVRRRQPALLRQPVLAGDSPWPWALLPVPLLALAGELFGLDWAPGSGRLTVAVLASLLAGSLLIVLLAPAVTADLGALALVAFGIYGVWLAAAWPDRVPLPSVTSPGAMYGAVVVDSRASAVLAGAQGVVLLALGIWLVPRTIGPHLVALRSAADSELKERVQRLTASRAEAVAIAADDLRRLERDLHDGAQARLVALGMSLRAAERLLPASPEAALALVAESREASARALTELRELVKGVHPPVLADRGLSDAIRALALDSPLQVDVEIDLPERPPAPIETACYFAVAELLTNAAKHSGARRATVTAEQTGGRLRITVADLGVGGANPANGTGLAGIEKRLASFDGILAVSSPVGGPTIVVLEVPCASSLPRTSSC